MKYFTLFLLAILLTACDNEPDFPPVDTYIFQTTSDFDGSKTPIQVVDFNDGTGRLTGRIIFDNAETVFDAIIDDIDGFKHNMILIPGPDELINDSYTFSATYWTDSISVVVSSNLGGFDHVETYTGTR